MHMTESVDVLEDLVSRFQRHAWLGHAAPFAFEELDIWGSSNFRVSPSHHQSYDVVWYYERDPADLHPGQFELVLDEMIRLLPDSGRLVFRFRQNAIFTVVTLKNLIGRRLGLQAAVEHEHIEDEEYTIVFEVRRDALSRYREKSWTFAILTQGKRLENLEAFFKSIRQQDPDCAHEILVCGPRLQGFEQYQLTYLDREYREQFAEISRKKNDLAQAARGANLCVVHDRYRLSEDFLAGFEKFGYDFDFATVPQWYECGERFPMYCAVTGDPLCWSPPLDCVDYNHLWPMQYLNGGLFICKTDTLREVPLNNLLFWNQAEDVELALAYRERKLPPRVNVFSSATTMGITPEYTRGLICTHGGPGQASAASEENGAGALRLSLAGSIKEKGRRLERRLRPRFKALLRRKSA